VFERAELDGSPVRIGAAAYSVIADEIRPLRLERILELGSGASTRALAVDFPLAEIVSYDHDSRFIPNLDDLPAHQTRVEVAPLVYRTVNGIPARTYSCTPEGAFQAAVVDGPPSWSANGRLGALLLAYNAVVDGGVLFLDDAKRAPELTALAVLRSMSDCDVSVIDVGHGLARIRKRGPLQERGLSALRVAPDFFVGVTRHVRSALRKRGP
jgi:hypothetical protein